MKRLLLILALLLMPAMASALPMHGSTSACPVGSPSPDGSIILPNSNCTLTDTNSPVESWNYIGTTLWRTDENGTNNMGAQPILEINSGHKAFTNFTCDASKPVIWETWSNAGWGLAAGIPGAISGSPAFTDTTQSVSSNSLDGLMTSGSVQDGDTVDINALPGNLWIWWSTGRINHANITFNFASGASLGCAAVFGNAGLAMENTHNGTTITGAGPTLSDIGYIHDTNAASLRCINLGNDNAWTVSNIYIHDCDFGLQANTTPSGTGTITNVVFDHNGGGGPSSTSTTHNIYIGWTSGLSTDLSTVTVSNVQSYCTNGSTAGPGFEFKTRWPQGTITNAIFANPSQHGYTDCDQSAAVDVSCGGAYTFGGSGAGTGVVFELGPSVTGSGNGDGVIRYGRDNQTGNCPSGGWPTSSLTIQNCWIINDSSFTITAIHPGTFTGGAPSMTVKNCKLVGLTGLGAGVIDGTGNTSYANRAAAGLAAYPALPSVP